MDRETLDRHVLALDTAAELLDLLAAGIDHDRRAEPDPLVAVELAEAASRAQQGWAHAVGAARALRDLRKAVTS